MRPEDGHNSQAAARSVQVSPEHQISTNGLFALRSGQSMGGPNKVCTMFLCLTYFNLTLTCYKCSLRPVAHSMYLMYGLHSLSRFAHFFTCRPPISTCIHLQGQLWLRPKAATEVTRCSRHQFPASDEAAATPRGVCV